MQIDQAHPFLYSYRLTKTKLDYYIGYSCEVWLSCMKLGKRNGLPN